MITTSYTYDWPPFRCPYCSMCWRSQPQRMKLIMWVYPLSFLFYQRQRQWIYQLQALGFRHMHICTAVCGNPTMKREISQSSEKNTRDPLIRRAQMHMNSHVGLHSLCNIISMKIKILQKQRCYHTTFFQKFMYSSTACQFQVMYFSKQVQILLEKIYLWGA